MEPVTVYCYGMFCPIRLQCLRYRPIINLLKEDHISRTPYDHEKSRCGHFRGDKIESHDKYIDPIRRS